MKIGLPKIRLSRKMLVIVVGTIIIAGGASATVVYVAKDKIMGPSEETIVGGACTDVLTTVLKTPEDRLWMRKYIRMDNVDGTERIRTALRVVGLLAKDSPVDLIQVSVLGKNGPTLRADMRARAIGAEVIFAVHPEYVPDMTGPFIARYYEGQPNFEGRYYGERVSLDLSNIKTMMTAMHGKSDLAECARDPAEVAKEAAAAKSEHKKKGKTKPTEAAPAEAVQPPVSSTAEHLAKTTSFFGRMLSMVGLGGSQDKAQLADPKSKSTEQPGENHFNITNNKATEGKDTSLPASITAGDHRSPATNHKVRKAIEPQASQNTDDMPIGD